MSNESAIVTEQNMENSVTSAVSENRGVSEENKIVPITPAAAQEATPVQEAVPAQEAAPIQEAAPVQKTIPTQGAVLVQEAVSVQETVPAQEAVPTQEAVPVQEAVPIQEAVPVQKTAPSSQSRQEPSDKTPKESGYSERTSGQRQKNSQDERDDFSFDEEERPKKSFFRFRSPDEEETRDKLILSRIRDEDLMEYLALEQRRLEFLQQSKELKQKRILTAFQLLISLASIVAITYLLKDNPTILISILYIVGIIAALNIWKNPIGKDKDRWKR